MPDASTTSQPTGSKLTMYSTRWCGYCHRLQGQLEVKSKLATLG
ncbi:MAG TPA: hypothetical protein VFD59_17530 [Nocardioidaceae bacterium]|nr:hypothetical protein [Nocardioidaceae bacterium]